MFNEQEYNKEYNRLYYQKVLKKRRKEYRKEHKQEIEQAKAKKKQEKETLKSYLLSHPREIVRTCPTCNTVYTELSSLFRPSQYKECPSCRAKKLSEKYKSPTYKKKQSQRARERWSTDSEYRERRKLALKKYLSKKASLDSKLKV